MSDMPDRIWAFPIDRAVSHGAWHQEVEDQAPRTEYVRADLVAEMVEALEPFVPPHSDWMDKHPDDMPSGLYMRTTFGHLRAAHEKLSLAIARAKGGTDDR